MINYEYMALLLSNLSSIPVRLYRDGQFAALFHSSSFKSDLAIAGIPKGRVASRMVSGNLGEKQTIGRENSSVFQ